MEHRRNEATINRPEGDRVLDAPYVFVDIPEYIRQLKEEEAWKKYDRNGITVFKTDNLTIVVVALHAHAVQPNNLVEGTVTIHTIEGRIRVTTPDGDIEIGPNQFITFHRCIDHTIQAIEDSVFLIQNNTFKEPVV